MKPSDREREREHGHAFAHLRHLRRRSSCEIGEEVERAGDEHRPVLACAGERGRRIGLDLDSAKCRSATVASSSAGSARAFDDWSRRAVARRPRARRASRRHPCRAGSRRRACSRSGRASREPGDAVGVVRAVPHLVPAPLEPSRQRDLDLAVDGRPRNASAASRAPPRTTFGPARCANSSSGSTAIVPSWTTASFSAAISSRVLAEHVGVLEPDVRQQDDVRAEDVRRVEPAAEARLDDRDVDLARRELGERRRADRLELRRLLRLRLRPDARDGGLEVGLLAVDRDPLGPAADVRRDRRADGEPFARRAAPRS